MQSTFTDRRWSLRSCVVLTCLIAVLVLSTVQVAHWCGDRTLQASVHSAQAGDGLCPICYSVPVGHGAAPAAMAPICIEASITPPPVAAELHGAQPEFHLHNRPPPAA